LKAKIWRIDRGGDRVWRARGGANAKDRRTRRRAGTVEPRNRKRARRIGTDRARAPQGAQQSRAKARRKYSRESARSRLPAIRIRRETSRAGGSARVRLRCGGAAFFSKSRRTVEAAAPDRVERRDFAADARDQIVARGAGRDSAARVRRDRCQRRRRDCERSR